MMMASRISILFGWILFLALTGECQKKSNFTYYRQAIVRGDDTRKQIALVFTGDLYADGIDVILHTLKEKNIKASFFLTGNFYRNPSFQKGIVKLRKGNHYLGAHSDEHLLYCSWENRDSLLVTKEEFLHDLIANYDEMEKHGIAREDARYFLPPFEWYNDSIAVWTKDSGFTLINFSPGTISHADYTTPDMSNYRSSDSIMESVRSFERNSPSGMNGFILLLHVGTDPDRTDKFYDRLGELVDYLQRKNYSLVRIDELLGK